MFWDIDWFTAVKLLWRTQLKQVVGRGCHCCFLACLYPPYLLPSLLCISLHCKTPPQACLSKRYRCEEEQTLLVICSLSLNPCFNTVEVEFPQRTWLTYRSTNTAKYSSMQLTESQQRAAMPQQSDTRCCCHHCRLNQEEDILTAPKQWVTLLLYHTSNVLHIISHQRWIENKNCNNLI